MAARHEKESGALLIWRWVLADLNDLKQSDPKDYPAVKAFAERLGEVLCDYSRLSHLPAIKD